MGVGGDSFPTLLRVFIHVGVVVILVLSLLLGFLRVYLPHFTHHGEEVAVPDVTQVSLEQAIHTLEGQRLRYVVINSARNPLRDPLTVVWQFPRAGEKVKVNRRVELWLNIKYRTRSRRGRDETNID